jgi:hypothetical protein
MPFQLGITKAPEYKVKSVPRPGRMEFTNTVEVFDRQEVVSKHACPTPRLTYAEAIANTTWQAMMSWNHSSRRDLKNPRKKKDDFKIS